MTEDELRKKAIKYLLTVKEDPKKDYEFTAKELSVLLKRSKQNTYELMEKLVKDGAWNSRMAFDQNVGRNIMVWWLVTKPE